MRKIAHVSLSLIFLFQIYGCATQIALEAAEKFDSKPKEYRKIVDVYPYALLDDESIKCCVKLSSKTNNDKDENFIISLPISMRPIKELESNQKDFIIYHTSPEPDLPVYWFSIDKTVKKCEKIFNAKHEPKSKVEIRVLSVPYEDWINLNSGIITSKEDVLSLLQKHNEMEASPGPVFAVKSIVSDHMFSENILLIYFPILDTPLKYCGVGIVGGYNDPSTKAGYAVVPFALALDVAFIVISVAFAILEPWMQ
ncbi:hypothetical protein ACFL5W_02680 [Thermodesulfobacteriota bacterium]